MGVCFAGEHCPMCGEGSGGHAEVLARRCGGPLRSGDASDLMGESPQRNGMFPVYTDEC